MDISVFCFHPAQGGSIRGFFWFITSSNLGQLKKIKICQSISPLVHQLVHPQYGIDEEMDKKGLL